MTRSAKNMTEYAKDELAELIIGAYLPYRCGVWALKIKQSNLIYFYLLRRSQTRIYPEMKNRSAFGRAGFDQCIGCWQIGFAGLFACPGSLTPFEGVENAADVTGAGGDREFAEGAVLAFLTQKLHARGGGKGLEDIHAVADGLQASLRLARLATACQ